MNLEDYLSTNDLIPIAVLVESMKSSDLKTMAHACYALLHADSRLQTRPNGNYSRQFLISYYLRCIKENIVPVDTQDNRVVNIASRFEAAHELCRLLEFSIDRNFKKEADLIVRGISDVFTEARAEVRNVIETGFLEHVFERPDLIELFKHWKGDPVYSNSYQAAIEWGRAHRRQK